MKRPGWRLAFLILSCTGLSTSLTLAEAPQWHGSVKALALYGGESPAGLSPDYWLSSNRLRLDMDWQPASNWEFEVAFHYQLLGTDLSGPFRSRGSQINRLTSLDHHWQHGEEAYSLLQVDRLNLRWRNSRLDVIAGRQAIGFGRILIFSPLDVVAPFAPDAFDTTVRSGVDALRAMIYYGLDGQFGAMTVFGKEARYDSHLVTWSDNHGGLDLLMIGGRLRGRPMLGAGLAGSLGTLGLKGEISLHRGRDIDEAGGDRADGFAIAAVETWYRFDHGLSLILQYLFNGPGEPDPEAYPEVLLSAPLQEGLTHLLGRHYLIAAPAYELHPLVTLQGILLWNLDDDSFLARPTLALSLADNLALEIFWTSHYGHKPQGTTAGMPPVPRSEFGMRGDNGGIFLKWFF